MFSAYCVLQQIGQSLREGEPPNLKLERFIEAVKDEEALLSYHALIGTRKQSVSNVEQIFSERVLQKLNTCGLSETGEKLVICVG